MFVHLSTHACNACYKPNENSLIDIPLEEVKLYPFALPCDCGYFYQAIHYSTSFNKWRVFLSKLKLDKEYLEKGIKTEEEFLIESPYSTYSKAKIIEYKKRLDKVLVSIEQNTTPIPDHLWVD